MSLHRYDFQDNLDVAKAELANNYEWSRDMKEWLIEQVERVQELEKERDEWKDTAQSYYMTNQELREQNKRYREALEGILDARNHFYLNEYVFGVEGIARQALESDNE